MEENEAKRAITKTTITHVVWAEGGNGREKLDLMGCNF